MNKLYQKEDIVWRKLLKIIFISNKELSTKELSELSGMSINNIHSMTNYLKNINLIKKNVVQIMDNRNMPHKIAYFSIKNNSEDYIARILKDTMEDKNEK